MPPCSGAARAIRESTPLGEVCGLVCPAGRLCEAACRRAETDTPLKISQLEALTCGFVPEPDGIVDFLAEKKQPGDVLCIMSNGGFGNIRQKLKRMLLSKQREMD